MPDIDLSIDRPKMKSYFFSETEDRRQKNREPRTPNPELRTANGELRTVNCEHREDRTQNSEPQTPNCEFVCRVRSTLSFVLNRHGLFTFAVSKIVQL